MDLFDTTQLALSRAAQAVSLRQQTLAGNLANANTPGYQRRDVEFHEALGEAMGEGKKAIGEVTFTAEVDGSAPRRGDDSNVDVDQESSMLAQSGLEYDALTQVMKSRIQILRGVISGSGG